MIRFLRALNDAPFTVFAWIRRQVQRLWDAAGPAPDAQLRRPDPTVYVALKDATDAELAEWGIYRTLNYIGGWPEEGVRFFRHSDGVELPPYAEFASTRPHIPDHADNTIDGGRILREVARHPVRRGAWTHPGGEACPHGVLDHVGADEQTTICLDGLLVFREL